jgi:hypothetical protein
MRYSLVLLLAAAAITVPAQSGASYLIAQRYALGGDGGWDYAVPDLPRHRVFVARQNRVMVINEDNGTLLGEVTGINGAHGTAIAEGTRHGFATSFNDQSVVMFDLETYKPLGKISAAEDADAIVYDSCIEKRRWVARHNRQCERIGEVRECGSKVDVRLCHTGNSKRSLEINQIWLRNRVLGERWVLL